VTTRRLISLAVLGLSACSTQPSVGSRFNGPTALAAFRGFSRKDAAIRDYLAVASSRGAVGMERGKTEPGLSTGCRSAGSTRRSSSPRLEATAR
jgi:hypothetical protein